MELFDLMATNPQSSAHQNNFSLDTVISDEIMDELEAFRNAYAAQFDYDIERMLADVREFGKRNPIAPIASIRPAERKATEK